jgi:hypothetical protein
MNDILKSQRTITSIVKVMHTRCMHHTMRTVRFIYFIYVVVTDYLILEIIC